MRELFGEFNLLANLQPGWSVKVGLSPGAFVSSENHLLREKRQVVTLIGNLVH